MQLARIPMTRRVLVVLAALILCLGFTQSHQSANAAINCNNVNYAYFGSYSTFTARCSYVGLNTTSRKYYSWSVQLGTNQNACVQAKGYDRYNNAYWVSLGCGTYGGASLLWGNNWAMPQIKARSVLSSLVAQIYWT
jgi:hypothetical protein